MKKYPNFYENIVEARSRLGGTTVLYGSLPYSVVAIAENLDNIFRVYLVPVGIRNKGISEIMNRIASISANHPFIADELDKLLEKYPDCGALRKYMNSKKFNSFRPFPLGMCNVDTQVFYVERQPIRPAMHQGLTKSAIYETLITTGSRKANPRRLGKSIDINSIEFRDCILADHYEPDVALKHLLNPKIANDALAFHREFAFCRGPLDTIYLAYRTDIIGLVPSGSLETVVIGKEFSYCREVVAELGLFNRVM